MGNTTSYGANSIVHGTEGFINANSGTTEN